jgi:phosphate-selective porin OprO/OprP
MDAYADLRFRPQAALRGGKFKPPLGLERLQSASDLAFAERGVPTNLVPNRDVGLELYGELAGGVLSYAAGVFDGTQDLGNNDGDRSDAKDVVARMFVKFDGVGLGIAASTGNEAGLASSPALPSYRTPGQQTLFSYRSDGTVAGTAVADGIRRRVVPQGYFYRGPLGLLWEYAASRQGVQLGDSVATLTHRAWQVAASVVLTGERASYRGVTPRRPFDAAANTWGAVELAARYGELLLDRAAFPTFADPTKSAAGGRSWAIGVNWYLARGVRLEANYERTSFADQGAGARRPEHFLVTRMQVGI